MNNNKIEEQFLLAIRLHSQWEEVWLPIRSYFNYEVSSQGRVRNLKTKKIMKQKIDKGYQQITLSEKGMQKTHQMHRLICSAFRLNPQCKPCVDHIDNNPSNNSIQNLRWATNSENQMKKTKQCNNHSGVTGVDWNKASKKWRASVQMDGIRKHLGYFSSLEKAKKARITAVDKMFGSLTLFFFPSFWALWA